MSCLARRWARRRALRSFIACFLAGVFFCAAGAAAPLAKTGEEGKATIADCPASDTLWRDFDGDGRIDTFCAYEDGLMAVLAGGRLVRRSGHIDMCCASIAWRRGAIETSTKGNRSFEYFRFRWDAAKHDFRLVGYATESFGNAAHDGSGNTSLNLLTGDYKEEMNEYDEKRGLVALPRVKRRIVLTRRVYLARFDFDTLEWLIASTSGAPVPSQPRKRQPIAWP